MKKLYESDEAFYDRILKGEETADDLERFYSICDSYSDMYKDIYGIRPRSEETMCVNGYSGHPDIDKFRALLKAGFNPLDDLQKAYESNWDWEKEQEEQDFLDSNPSKDEIVSHDPEYEKYFVDDDFEDIYENSYAED